MLRAPTRRFLFDPLFPILSQMSHSHFPSIHHSIHHRHVLLEQALDGKPSAVKPKRKRAVNAATLESNLAALNLKKLERSFGIDPLFHRTSAKFDAGGARGLLLHNLSVREGCKLVFDSSETTRYSTPPTLS